jgi:hypothetical protein
VLLALERHAPGLLARRPPSPRRRRVLRKVLTCRTAAAGAHLFVCEDCGATRPIYNSCLDRHCPQCQGPATARWLETRKERMLPTPHFQVTFTLPAELRGVAMGNQKVVYGLMFRVAASVLRDLGQQRLQARLGVLAVLHTWKSDLGYHPHVHCLVTAGGLHEDDDRWVASKPEWLFHHKVLGAMFRGRFTDELVAALDRGELTLRGDPEPAEHAFRAATRAVSRKHARWVVHVEAPKGRPAEHVVGYLARYVKRVAIADARVLAVTDATVTIATRQGPRTLEGGEFVRRFLNHVLPRSFRKVRYYGLYAPGNAKLRLERAKELLHDHGDDQPEPEPEPAASRTTNRAAAWRCPECSSHRTHRVFVLARGVVRIARAPP